MDKNENVHIYVAEDDKVTRFLLKRVLGNFPNIDFELFENGEELLKGLSAKRPQVILLDVNMPVMDAYQFMDKFEKQGELIILLIGTPLPEEKKEWFSQKGCDGFLIKPLNGDKIEWVLGMLE